jgi:hypothetical protein
MWRCGVPLPALAPLGLFPVGAPAPPAPGAAFKDTTDAAFHSKRRPGCPVVSLIGRNCLIQRALGARNERRLDEIVEVAVQHAVDIPHLVPSAQVLHHPVGV